LSGLKVRRLLSMQDNRVSSVANALLAGDGITQTLPVLTRNCTGDEKRFTGFIPARGSEIRGWDNLG
jgi:hypothetical protein